MTKNKPTRGLQKSEFLGPLGFLLVAWTNEDVAPEALIWPSTVVLALYIFGRSMVYTAHEVSYAISPHSHDEPDPEEGEELEPAGGVSVAGAAGKAIAGVLVGLLVLGAPSCSALQSFLGQPVGTLEGQPGVVTIPTPDGGQVLYETPVGPTPEPIPIEIPGGGTATYVPPQQPWSSPTVGSVAGETAGGILGMLTGNPAVGAIAAALLGGLGGMAGRRRKR